MHTIEAVQSVVVLLFHCYQCHKLWVRWYLSWYHTAKLTAHEHWKQQNKHNKLQSNTATEIKQWLQDKIPTLVSMMRCRMSIQRWFTSSICEDADLPDIWLFFTNALNSSTSSWWGWISIDRFYITASSSSSSLTSSSSSSTCSVDYN